MSDWQDYYSILGIGRNASQDEIKEAFRYKARTCHPDFFQNDSDSMKRRAEGEFIKIKAAHDILINHQTRDQYNLEWDKRNQSNPRTKPNQPPVLTKLECDHPSPQVSGTTIVYTAHASDPDGDPIYYRFWLKGAFTNNSWHPVTEWTRDNRWTWNTTSKNVGDNQIKVEVRDGYHAGTSGYDDLKIIDVTINTNWDSQSEMNELEKKFFDAANKRIPDLIPQYEVRTIAGKSYRLDFAKIIKYDLKRNKTLKMAIELDGQEFHKTKEQRTNDAERQHNLELDGWRFIRFTGSQIYKDTNHCIYVTEKLIDGYLKDLLEKEPLESSSNKVDRPPFISKLIFDSIQPQYPGSVIRWTAEATSPDHHPIYYRFWLKGPATGNIWHSMTDWIWDNHWTWKPKKPDVGDNTIKVEVRDGKHAGSSGYDDQRVENYIIHTKSLIYDTECLVKVAAAVLLLLILFWFVPGFFGSNKQPDVSSLPSNALSSKVTEAATSQPLPPNSKPVIESLIPDKSSPQNVGATISWTASTKDQDLDQIYFKFWLKGPWTGNYWRMVRDWSTSNDWIWETANDDTGYYQIAVDVRDGNHAVENNYDAEMVENFVLNSPILQKPKLSPDKPSPQSSGSIIDWNATGLGSYSETIYYRFLLSGPSTGNTWKVTQDWDTGNTWSWSTSSLDVGDNEIKVQVSGGYPVHSDDAEEIAGYTIISPLPTEDSSIPSSSSPPLAQVQPNTQKGQEIGYDSAKTSISSSESIPQPDKIAPTTDGDTPETPGKSSALIIEDKQTRKVIQIGDGIKQPNEAIQLGEKGPKKTVYLGGYKADRIPL